MAVKEERKQESTESVWCFRCPAPGGDVATIWDSLNHVEIKWSRISLKDFVVTDGKHAHCNTRLSYV